MTLASLAGRGSFGALEMKILFVRWPWVRPEREGDGALGQVINDERREREVTDETRSNYGLS